MKKTLILIFFTLKILQLQSQDSHNKRFTGTLTVGAWVPTNSLQKVGTHAFYGGRIGVLLTPKFSVDFLTDIRFLNSKNNYDYRYKGVIESDNYFRSVLIGLQLEYKIINKSKYEIAILGGIGLDRLEFKDKSKGFYKRLFDSEIASNSLNLNAGVVYDKLVSPEFRIGIFAYYSFVDYTKSNRITYKGNTITLGIRAKIYGAEF